MIEDAPHQKKSIDNKNDKIISKTKQLPQKNPLPPNKTKANKHRRHEVQETRVPNQETGKGSP